jgi:hypothetical protein
MAKGWTLKSVAGAAVVAASSSVGGGTAQATTTWRSTTALSGLFSSRFGSDCRWTYNGTAIFETTSWVCWRPYDQIMCSVDRTLMRSTNCRTNMPYAISTGTSTLAGPTEAAR